MTINRRLVIALGVTALAGAAVVQAEQLGQAAVPFAFEVAGTKLTAGTYSAVRQGQGAIQIRSASGQTVLIMPRQANSTTSDQSSLKFVCYGSNCFLSQLKFGQSQKSYDVPRSHHEKELASTQRSEEKLIAMR